MVIYILVRVLLDLVKELYKEVFDTEVDFPRASEKFWKIISNDRKYTEAAKKHFVIKHSKLPHYLLFYL